MKLEIFRISLKKPGGSKTDLHNYDEFFKDAFKKDASEEAYQEFIKEFIAYFKNEFMLNRDGSKAISTNHRSRFIHRSNKNIIDGELIGGNTGIPQVIYNQKDSNNNTGDISEDEVSTLPFYFKIWTPPNHNTGVLMIQSYSQQTVTFLVRLHLAKFFKKYDFSIIISPFVPNKLKEYFKKRSKVYKVAFVKESLNRNKRKLLNPLFTNFTNLKIKIEVSGFIEEIDDFWKGLRGQEKIIAANLEDFDMVNNDDYQTIAYYKDEEGHRSHTSIKKNFDIKPTVFLSEVLKEPSSEYYDFHKIKDHTDSILLDIQSEIGYLKHVE